MERARWKAVAASRNNSAGGAAGWTALRAPESREKCEMLYVCHVCHPVNLTGRYNAETYVQQIAHSLGAEVFNRLKNTRIRARASESVCISAQPCACNAAPCILCLWRCPGLVGYHKEGKGRCRHTDATVKPRSLAPVISTAHRCGSPGHTDQGARAE